MQFFKKLLPFQKQAADKPLHSGEIYYLWEGLTSGYKLIEVTETYLMNTEDEEIHTLLLLILKGVDLTRIKQLEKLLKQKGFTVPPRPATKTTQGNPGTEQEVKLSDDEVLFNLIAWGRALLQNDAKAIGTITGESVRKIFIDLIFDDIKTYNIIFEFNISRNAFPTPPAATSKDNGLNMEEVSLLWSHLIIGILALSTWKIT